MELVIVGSAGYDDIETPLGKVSGLLGGSAIYSGLSAAFHARDIGLQRLSVGIVSIVGEDFDPDSERKLRQSGLDLRGLKRSTLPTFRWSGRYEGSMDHAETVSTELNSLVDFNPDFPSGWKTLKSYSAQVLAQSLRTQFWMQIRKPLSLPWTPFPYG